MWLWPILTFVVVLGIGLVFAQLAPTSRGWIAAECLWVTIATLAIFTAMQEARTESQSFERKDRIRNIELNRYIARQFAESQIFDYRRRLQERELPEQEQQTWRDGIQWFDSASEALRDVQNSEDWKAYLPGGRQFEHFAVPEPDISRADWVAESKLRLSEFVTEIKDSFDRLDDLELDIASKNRMTLLILITPYLLAIAGALELAAVRARTVAGGNLAKTTAD
jgi:hypothetical protein